MRDLVRNVGERGCALIGGNNEVGIFAVATNDAFRSNDFAVDHVVGDVEQPADKSLVTGDARFHDYFTVTLGHLLAEEAAFGTCGYDDRVLDDLGFHQAQHLGAEVFAAV